MCLAVYLGTDRPVEGFAEVAIGDVGLQADPEQRPAALSAKAHIYHVADRVPTGWNCSCIFLDTVLPWEMEKGDDPADPDTPKRAAAYAGLSRIAEAAVKADPDALIFSCWWGEQESAPKITRDLAPGDIRPARLLFDDPETGGNPPILIRLGAAA